MHDRNFMVPGKSVALAENGMAATSHPPATLAAVEILKAGGNGRRRRDRRRRDPMRDRSAHDRHRRRLLRALRAGRRPADVVQRLRPGAAGRGAGRYLSKGWTAIPDDSAHAVTVPGAVDAWCRLNSEHGRLELDEILAPAIRPPRRLRDPAARGADWPRYASRVAAQRHRARFLPGGRRRHRCPADATRRSGATLRRIAREGRNAFYEGDVAEEIVATLKALGGLQARTI